MRENVNEINDHQDTINKNNVAIAEIVGWLFIILYTNCPLEEQCLDYLNQWLFA